jgi:hypothetical protein
MGWGWWCTIFADDDEGRSEELVLGCRAVGDIASEDAVKLLGHGKKQPLRLRVVGLAVGMENKLREWS